MEFLYFAIIAVVLYFLSDKLLTEIEKALGRRLEYRSVIFFFILLVSALISFTLIRQLFG